MRAALAAASALAAVLLLSACDKGSDAHLKAAGDEIKAAAKDVGKAVDVSSPKVKEAGAKIGDDIREAGHKAAPAVRAAGRDLKEAADKAGAELKDAGHKAKDSVEDKKDD